MANIPPPNIRRQKALCCLYTKTDSCQNSLLYEFRRDIPPDRLKSRKPPWHCFVPNFNINEKWSDTWYSNLLTNGSLILDPCKQLKGFNLPRHNWSKLNIFRSGQGRCSYLLKIYSSICDCQLCDQTMYHIAVECPLRKYGGLERLHHLKRGAMKWLKNLDVDV